jgi:hypothetical protein
MAFCHQVVFTLFGVKIPAFGFQDNSILPTKYQHFYYKILDCRCQNTSISALKVSNYLELGGKTTALKQNICIEAF